MLNLLFVTIGFGFSVSSAHFTCYSLKVLPSHPPSLTPCGLSGRSVRFSLFVVYSHEICSAMTMTYSGEIGPWLMDFYGHLFIDISIIFCIKINQVVF